MTRPERDRLEALLSEVRVLAAPFGKKAALARHLGVPRQHLNAWLSGLYEPSGRVTLELVEWVRLERAKDKTRTARERRPGKQTRKGNREKSKTGPPRSGP